MVRAPMPPRGGARSLSHGGAGRRDPAFRPPAGPGAAVGGAKTRMDPLCRSGPIRGRSRKEGSHVRSDLPGRGAGLFCVDGRLRALGGPSLTMFDLVLGGAVALALAAYLVYALARPERF
ncbi:K(+)-transporting ATPase subunit F [Aureimonas jatrophae]|uniref:K(+)-transporting ATPase subunit F n=1 Tax=Aureimonas jatrophae TaxID=1166073 RepID=UPI003CC7AE4D